MASKKEKSLLVKGLTHLPFQELIDAIPVPLFFRNTESKYLAVNRSFVSMLGDSQDYYIGKGVEEIFAAESAQEYRERDLEILERDEIQIYETKIIYEDKKQHDVIFRKTRLVDGGGRPIGVVGVIIDISKRKKIEKELWDYRNYLEHLVMERTKEIVAANKSLQDEIEKRKQSEQALMASEKLLRTILDSTYDAIVLLNPAGHINQINHKGLEMFQIGDIDITSLDFLRDLSAPDCDVQQWNDVWRAVLQGEDRFIEWKAFRPQTMSSFAVELFIHSIQIGEQTLILLNIRDISSRKEAEAIFHKQHEQLETAWRHEKLLSTIATRLNTFQNNESELLELLEIIAKVLTLKQVSITRFNGNFGEIPLNELTLRYPRETIDSLGEEPATLTIPIKVAQKRMGLLSLVQEADYTWTTEEYTLFSALANMIANAWEKIYQFEARLLAEQKNTQSVQMIEQSFRLASVGVMAAGITHEINQPLNAIRVAADSMLFWDRNHSGQLPEAFIDKLQKISLSSKRIDDIIRHMRSFWSNQSQENSEILFIKEPIEKAVELLDRQILSHGIHLLKAIADDELLVKGNLIQFEQILTNLIVNAMHSLDQVSKIDKTIKILVYEKDDYVTLEVRDNGLGLPEDMSEKLFDPFYSTKHEGKGMGLGLAIVKRFVDNFQGRIEAFNSEQGEAVFRITFPAVKEKER